MKTYYPTIGLEIHAELTTKSKMFCACKNDASELIPNKNICPVCTAQPGALPTINKEALHSMVKIGTAVGGTIADVTEFDRKNYFYPDIPKGYQISQFRYPTVSGGSIAGIPLTRIHLEEDTATSVHKDDHTLVDFNRAGVPLMELVTEPAIHDGETVVKFAKELQMLLRYLGVSSANMEQGQMRVEVNISLSDDPNKLGTKVEVKNIGSISFARKAVDYEIKRQTELLEKGEKIIQETRGFDAARGTTMSQRSKEDAHDYRYFPDPDLPKLSLHTLFNLESVKKNLSELPWERRERYATELGIKADDIETYLQSFELAAFFESVVALLGSDKARIQLASNYITSDLTYHMKQNESFVFPEVEHFAKLITLLADGKISSRGAKDILEVLHIERKDPEVIAQDKGLFQQSDEGALKKIIEETVSEHATVAAEYKAGKEASLMFLVGQVMKKTKGSANPGLVQKLLKEVI